MWPWLPPVGFRIQDPGDSREGAHMAEMEFQEEAQGRSLPAENLIYSFW